MQDVVAPAKLAGGLDGGHVLDGRYDAENRVVAAVVVADGARAGVCRQGAAAGALMDVVGDVDEGLGQGMQQGPVLS